MVELKENWKNFLYGSFAGMSGIIISHPFDTIKTNYQEGRKVFIRNLYKGILSPLIGVGLEKAIVFGVYETSRNYINNDFVCGGLSGFCASGVVTPFERIKVLLQTNQTLPSKLGLYKGFSATLSRETPGFAIYFSVYNYLKKDEKNISPYKSFLYGGISATISWVFIYPQDRIKTHIQIEKYKHISFLDATKEIYNKNGFKSFYKGFQFALLRAIPLHATAFTVMEWCKKHL